jgi:type III secretion apparatus needle protein
MTITPEDFQRIQQNLQKIDVPKMRQEFEAAFAAVKNDPTSPENLAKLQQAMGAYSSSLTAAAGTIKQLKEVNDAILGKL